MPPTSLQDELLQLLAERPATARSLVDRLVPARAFTTVATVLARLETRGWVRRERGPDGWVWSVSSERDRALGAAVGGLLDRVVGDPEPVLAAFLDGVEGLDPALLDRLEAMIDARRGPR